MSSDDEKDHSRERSTRRERGPNDRQNRNKDSSRDGGGRDRSIDRGRDRAGLKSSSTRVYVSNIPYEYRWQDLKDLFRSQVGDVQFVELFVDETDRSKGCGIVEFADSQSVKKALEVMQRFDVKGRKLIIKEDAGNARDKYGNIIGGPGGGKRNRDDNRRRDNDRFDSQSQMSGRGGGGGGDAPENKWGNTYGLSPHFLESLRIDSPLSNRVFVANLPYSVDKKKLKEVFRLAGRVIRVDVPLDKDGRTRGFAFIEYDHPVEAVQAVSMFNNQVLNDREMAVRLDLITEKLKLPEGLKGIGMGLGSNGEPLRDVARNLPSSNNNASQSNIGAGILGSVPNNAFQVANALSGLNSVVGSGFTNSSLLQAANLAGVGNLASSLGLNAADLQSLAASNLVSNPLIQNNSQFGAIGNPANLANLNVQPFSSNQNSFGAGQNQAFSNNSGGGGGHGFQSPFESNKMSGVGGGNANAVGGYGSGYGATSRDSFGSANIRGGGGAAQSLRSPVGSNIKEDFPRKVLISNLPASVSFKMLTEKFSEFGDVQHVEEKGTGCMLVVYAAHWQAERAIKNLDRARIDGRTIELEYNVDKKKLKEVFRLAGRVIRVDVPRDKDGRSRGFAVVEYDHPVEAVQAVSMFNNQVLNDRPMAVRLDRVNETLKLPEGLKGIGMGLGSNGEPLRDVARNLPSNNNSASQSSVGSGILGAVPNNAFQVASALSGLNNVVGGASGLGGLANSSMLQANLAGVGNLASSLGLNAADLQSLAASNLVSNPLVQNSSQFGGLGNQSNLASSNVQAFSSNQNASVGGQNQAFSNNSGGGRGFQSAFESNKMSGVGGGNAGAVGGYGSGYGVGVGTGGIGQLLRSQAGSNIKDGSSRKILISNLPATASFKILSEKFSEFGDVQHLEEKGTGSMLVVYASDWQAERAIKNLDRARVDGRTIDARYFY